MVKKVLSLLLLPLFLIGCSGGNHTASLDIDESTGEVTIKVSNFSKSDAKHLKVAVICGTTIENTVPIARDGKASYTVNQLFEGECYSFHIVTADKEQIAKNVTWDTPNQYCKPRRTEEEVDPDVSVTYEENLDSKPYSYTVTFHVINLRQLQGGVEYTLGDKTQSDSIFQGIAPGDYEATVRSGSKSRSIPIFLRDITGPVKPLTKEELQAVLDQVGKGRLSAGEANEKIARGELLLAAPVGGMTTLMAVLQELEFGALVGDAPHYTVVGFENDKKTGRIVSGTLRLK